MLQLPPAPPTIDQGHFLTESLANVVTWQRAKGNYMKAHFMVVHNNGTLPLS